MPFRLKDNSLLVTLRHIDLRLRIQELFSSVPLSLHLELELALHSMISTS